MDLRSLASSSGFVTCLALFSGLSAAGCGGNGNGNGTAGSFYDPASDTAASPDLTVVCGASPGGPVQGYDVSVYQGDFNWGGVQFGAARVSDGTGYIDPKFNENWIHMKSNGIIRAAYQFFEPGESEVAQANLVISKVGRLGDGDLPVMLDVEVTGGQSAATIRAKAKHWLDLVEAGTGKKPFVYSYGSFLQTYLGSGFGEYPLWIANYGPSCPSVPTGWSNWTIWQYSDGSGHLDHDVFNGTEAQLKALAGVAAPVGPPTQAPAAPTGCGGIAPGHGIFRGTGLTSCDSRFTLEVQTDGNLVLYLNGGGALWSSHTAGTDGYAATLQSDGNFVLYGKHSNALWSSRTGGQNGSHFDLQGDGNMVVYNGSKAVWASGTFVMNPPSPPTGCSSLQPGQGLTLGESILSCDKHYALAMQGDGNLVLYHGGVGATWATRTAGSPGYTAIMQADGNFVLYDQRARALWSSKTNGHPGSHLQVQEDGNLVVYHGSTALWASHTSGR